MHVIIIGIRRDLNLKEQRELHGRVWRQDGEEEMM